MEGNLHGSARTTPRIRVELQASKESNRQLTARYRLNVKTVAKWRSRSTTMDSRMGPALPRSEKLTLAEFSSTTTCLPDVFCLSFNTAHPKR